MSPFPSQGLQTLARAPAPRCPTCKTPLRDVRPFHAEQPHAGLAVVHCLSGCRCGGKFVVQRRLAVTPQGTRFLGQQVEVCTEEMQEKIGEAVRKEHAASHRKKGEAVASKAGNDAPVASGEVDEPASGNKRRWWPFGKREGEAAPAA